MTVPNLNDPAILAFLQQLQAQQQAPAAPTVAGTAIPVQAAAPVPEPTPTVAVDVSDVLGRNGYGPSLFNADNPVGTSFTGTVAQPTTARQQRDYDTKEPKFFKDGNPIPELVIGLDVPVSDQHPEGRATWYAKGKDITAINTAMTQAGVPTALIKQGLEVGATLTVTFVREQKNPKFPHAHPAKIREVVYTRPGSAPTPAPVAQVAQIGEVRYRPDGVEVRWDGSAWVPPVVQTALAQVPAPAPQPVAPAPPAVAGAQDPAAILAALVAAQKPAA
jgi:hypothetical protein